MIKIKSIEASDGVTFANDVEITVKTDNKKSASAKKIVKTEEEYVSVAENLDEDKINPPISIDTKSAVTKEEQDRGREIDRHDGNSKDGEIQNTKQHATGDCWILSAVNAMSYTEEGRKIIKGCLEYRDGYTIVHLAVGDYIVTDDEVAGTKGSDQYSSGDDDMIIFELAIEKVLDDIATGKLVLTDDAPSYLTADAVQATREGCSSTEYGWTEEALYYITGMPSRSEHTKSGKESVLDEFIENGGQNYALTATINKDCKSVTVRDVFGKKVELPVNHAYAIKKADKSTVTIINPWDSSQEIILRRDVFIETFDHVIGTNLGNDITRQLFKKNYTQEVPGERSQFTETCYKLMYGNTVDNLSDEDRKAYEAAKAFAGFDKPKTTTIAPGITETRYGNYIETKIELYNGKTFDELIPSEREQIIAWRLECDNARKQSGSIFNIGKKKVELPECPLTITYEIRVRKADDKGKNGFYRGNWADNIKH